MKSFLKHELKNPVEYHISQEMKIKPALHFDPEKDYETQRAAIDQKLRELLSIPEKRTNPVPLIETEDDSDSRFDEIRFVVETEPDFYVPAHLWLPKSRKAGEKLPLMICLQGHTAGMHVSMGRADRYPSKEPAETKGDRDFCIQSIARGYAALAVEQRGFGELSLPEPLERTCHMLSWQALLMGKTLLGERMNDISRVIDAVETGFDCIDTARISITGNSGGGTSSYYAISLDKRIAAAMPSSCFCNLAASWGTSHHCDCAYVPNMLKYMEMSDLAVLIAPRPLVLVIGTSDPINPLEWTKQAFAEVQGIYRAAGAEDNCRLVIGREGHRFYAADAWPVFEELYNR